MGAGFLRDGRLAGGRDVDAELAGEFGELGGLLGEGVCRGGAFLDHGGVLLRDLVHLVDGDIDLAQAGGLFVGGGGDLGDDAADLGNVSDDAVERLAGLADEVNAAPDMLARGGDQRFDLLGRFGRTLREGADFRGDDGETSPGITGTGGFDAGVQREQVGLEGDLVDDADDLADLVGGVLDLAHGRDGLPDDLAGFVGLAARIEHGLAGAAGAVGGAADGVGDLLQRRGGLLERGGLLLGSAGQIVGRFGDFGGAGADGRDIADEAADEAVEMVGGGVVVVPELLVFGGEAVLDTEGQVAGGELRKTVANAGDHAGLGGGVTGAGRFEFRGLVGSELEVDRQHQLHIEHGHAEECRNLSGKLLVGAAPVPRFLAIVVGDDDLGHQVDEDGVGGDVEVGAQADPVMDGADGLGGGQVFGAEIVREHPHPVLGLFLAGGAHVLLAGEETDEFLALGDVLVEPVENGGHLGLEQRHQGFELGFRRRVDVQEGEPILEG